MSPSTKLSHHKVSFIPWTRGTTQSSTADNLPSDTVKKLGILDKLLSPLIILFMILGVVIGEFSPHVQKAFDAIDFHGVSVRESIPVRLPKRINTRILTSNCDWVDCNDVAHPHRSSVRTIA